MRNTEKSTRSRLALIVAIAAPLAAGLLYAGAIDRPFDATDLEIIAQNQGAIEAMTSSRIWLDPIPYDRLDLGMYRPFHGLALAIQYAWWPLNSQRFHAASLGLFVLLGFLYFLFVARVFRGENRGASWGVAVAVLIFVLHPMATESVNLASAQNVLIAALAWVGALWICLLASETKIPVLVASPLVALAYFKAFGAYEPAVLLPLALLSLGLLRNPAVHGGGQKGSGNEREGAANRSASPLRRAGWNLLVYGLPLLVIASVLIVLRMNVLDGEIGPAETVRALGEMSPGSRAVAGCSAMAMGIFRLLIPWRPTFFYEPRYEEALIWPAWIGVPIFLLALGLLIFAAGRNRTFALGLALTLIPLLAFSHLVPANVFFSERVLLLALPGIGILGGEVARLLVSRTARVAKAAGSRSRSSKLVPGAGIAMSAIAIAILAPITLLRNLLWSDSSRLWAAEAEAHPLLPQPHTFQMIDLISRSNRQFDLPAIEAQAEEALRLGKAPDTDLVYQYLAVMHFERRDAEELTRVIEEAIEAPGPHVAGYYGALGSAALRLGLFDLADTTLRKELAKHPDDFDTLYQLTEIALQSRRWDEALKSARRATAVAPTHLQARAFLQRGLAAAWLNDATEGTEALNAAIESEFALRRAIELDDTMLEPYLALSRLLVGNQRYADAETVLVLGRRKARMSSMTALFAVQVDSLELQGSQTKVHDFLHAMSSDYPHDFQLQFYAGKYLLEHGQYRYAQEIYSRILIGIPDQPDALVGLGILALAAGNDASQAERYWSMALQSNPDHAQARMLLEQLRSGAESQDPD
ncbi:tetratricopeptide repeat protein [Candidatus Sumerlaeota bacterium]|nr:tetratricopeptide repeat protein [Candidatus Sumerlaeota bacterium]